MSASATTGAALRIVVLAPHLLPDTAPTGVVMSRIVRELAARGHRVHVVTSLPWYRAHAIEPEWQGRLVRTERTTWGDVQRIHPFPSGDKRNLLLRGVGFLGFSALAGLAGLRAGGWFRRADAVIAMSPPLTLGLTGWLVGVAHRAPLVFNVQDVFPDAAVETGAISDRRVIALARRLEALTYRVAAAVTVLSEDLRANVAAKLSEDRRERVVVIPNFVDTDVIRPADRLTPYRRELGIGDEPVVMYAGNVGLSQSLGLVVEAARRIPEVTFVINGDGSARRELEELGRDVANLRIVGYQPAERLPEVLASADVHVVPLRAGLGRVSVPSKTYSILAAARPVLAAIDAGTEVPRILERSGGGLAVSPDDADAFVQGLEVLLADPVAAAAMGRRGREWVVAHASPAAVGRSYEELVRRLAR